METVVNRLIACEAGGNRDELVPLLQRFATSPIRLRHLIARFGASRSDEVVWAIVYCLHQFQSEAIFDERFLGSWVRLIPAVLRMYRMNPEPMSMLLNGLTGELYALRTGGLISAEDVRSIAGLVLESLEDCELPRLRDDIYRGAIQLAAVLIESRGRTTIFGNEQFGDMVHRIERVLLWLESHHCLDAETAAAADELVTILSADNDV